MAKFQISFLRYHPVGIYESMNLKSQGEVHFHAPIGAIVFLWANNKGKMSYPLLTSVCPSALTTLSPSYFSLRWPNLTKNITAKYWPFFKESLDIFVFHGNNFFSLCLFPYNKLISHLQLIVKVWSNKITFSRNKGLYPSPHSVSR